MKKAAKLIIESGNEYLIMYRSDHPTFGDDPDLPGGTAEDDESELETMLREVKEEAGLHIASAHVKNIYSGAEYSDDTHFSLFIVSLSEKPKIVMSWEHSSYKWVTKKDFIKIAKTANDTYMHMAGDILSSFE